MGTAVIADDAATIAAQAEVDAAEAARVAAESAQGTVVADPAKPVEYDLKWPDGSTADPAIVDRTVAFAKAQGLSNEAGQALLNERVKEIAGQQASADALVAAFKPGGAEWTKQNAEFMKESKATWEAAARKDPEIIGPAGDQFDRTIQLAAKAMVDHFPNTRQLLEDAGFSNHPAILKDLANLARKSGEGAFIQGNTGQSSQPRTLAERMYGADGTGEKKE